jgi:hypothetical protein
MNPLNVLAPNHMSYSLENTGVESMTTNMGWGVNEVLNRTESVKRTDNSGMNDIRRAKAREFGTPMDNVGF